jgi:hypothetical protein
MAQSPEGRIVLSLLKLDGFLPMEPGLFDGIAKKVALTGLGRGR